MSHSNGVRVEAATEARNPATRDIDTLSTLDALRRINELDAQVPAAVAAALPQLAELADAVVERLSRGGRLHYVGAGTSGRIAVLDAAEVPPTYGLDVVVAHLAGGPAAMTRAVEGAEDDVAAGAADLGAVSERDVVVGVAASGRTPYVQGALEQARAVGAFTGLVSANPAAPLGDWADVHVCADTGPEAIAGSTRMKAATAQKLILTSLTTVVAVRLGRTWSNLMVDMAATNQKLRGRSVAMLEEASGASAGECVTTLDAAGGELKTALVCLLAQVDVAEARRRLVRADGVVRAALHQP